jgi:hypothetical protein
MYGPLLRGGCWRVFGQRSSAHRRWRRQRRPKRRRTGPLALAAAVLLPRLYASSAREVRFGAARLAARCVASSRPTHGSLPGAVHTAARWATDSKWSYPGWRHHRRCHPAGSYHRLPDPGFHLRRTRHRRRCHHRRLRCHCRRQRLRWPCRHRLRCLYRCRYCHRLLSHLPLLLLLLLQLGRPLPQ